MKWSGVSFIAERNGGLPYVRSTIATPIEAQVIVNLDERLNVKRAPRTFRVVFASSETRSKTMTALL